ncbi:Hint domain-containing protein [Carnimonas bestiolae]|uniref:Hint domain-containing protein n=1 Tax=Carnimonas bestiolae TaxID=3402172 RepID=UPI003EDBE1F6
MATYNEITDRADEYRANVIQNGPGGTYDEWKAGIDQFKDLAGDIKTLDERDQERAIKYVDGRLDSLRYSSTPSPTGRDTDPTREETDAYIDGVKDYIGHYGCFTEGTLISTPSGEVAIETLKQGDLVNTLSGPKALKWVGFRTLTNMEKWNNREKANNYPVHILANALADGVPARDIAVSAWHHLYVNNVLVRAMDLVNGKTIYQEESVKAVKYFHLELDSFDVILAHGVYSESYSDNGANRGFYDNAVTAIRPQSNQRGGIAPRPGFSVIRPNRNADVLVAIKQSVDARAEEQQTRQKEAVSA